MAQEPNEITGNSASRARQDDAAASSPSPATTEIRSQIEHTRAEITQTIDAIEHRLSPSRIMTEAKQTVRDATLGRAQRLAAKTHGALGDGRGEPLDTARVIEALRATPIPLVIAGIAATALVARAAMHRNNRRFWLGAGTGLACLTAWRTACLVGSEDAAHTFELLEPTSLEGSYGDETLFDEP